MLRAEECPGAPWRPRVAFLVSESTLLPVFTRLTPAVGWPARIVTEVAAVLAAHGVSDSFVADEVRQMGDRRLGPTASRSLVGVMNDFVRLADFHRGDGDDLDLLELSLRLSSTPFRPPYARSASPDREFAAVVRSDR